MTRKDGLLHEAVTIMNIVEPPNRVTFERDEGQEYLVGARVSVHAMNGLFRTVILSPSDGTHLVTRCEKIRDIGWQALRISLRRLDPRQSDAAPSVGVALEIG